MLANSGDPDHMQHCAASDQGLHCLSMSYKKDTRNTPRLCLFIVCFVMSLPIDASTHTKTNKSWLRFQNKWNSPGL